MARPRVGYACSTRQASSRTLRAVDVQEVSLAALEAIAARAGGFLRAALRSEVQVLLESSVMQTRSGAADQSFHADTGACDPRLASVQVSLVDTAADQGALEVAPGTQRGGAPAGEGEGTVVAVPAGTVLFYAPSASHRGRGNRLGRDRLFLGLTLLGEGGVVPPGIPYALQPHDLGRWCLRGGGDEAAAGEAGLCGSTEFGGVG